MRVSIVELALQLAHYLLKTIRSPAKWYGAALWDLKKISLLR